MREKLYLPLEKRSLRYAYYMYLDVKPYLADQLFIRHKVRVWFDGEYAKDGFPYTMILCHVRKKDVPAFLDNLERLKEEELHGKNDPAGKAVQSQPA